MCLMLPAGLLLVPAADFLSLPLPLPFLPQPSVENRNPRLLSQHPGFAYWLQDRSANRPEHSDGAFPPEAGAHLL